MNELGFVDNPKDQADYNNLPTSEDDATQLRGIKNGGYLPHKSTVKNGLKNCGIDQIIIDKINDFLKTD